jgi:diguanylate cyclase (GGDEF)-like protein
LLALLLACLAGPTTAAPTLQLADESSSAELLPALEFLLDTEGGLSLDQVAGEAAAKFAPALANTRYRSGNGSLWLRFSVIVEKPELRWRLTVPLPGLDKATLYFRDGNGQWLRQQAGDTRPMSEWTQPGRYPIFSLSREAGKPVTYYLQIQHPRIPFSAMPRILSDVNLVNGNQAEHMLLGIYFGLAVLVVLLALVNAVLYRDGGFGSYAVYIGVFAAAQAAFTGVAGLYLWPAWIDANRATMLLLPLSAASAMWFVRTVAMPARFFPLLDRLILALILVLPLAGLIDASAPAPWSYTMMNSLIGSSMLVMLATVGLALRAGDINTRWLAAGFLPVLLSALFPLLRNFNLIASGYLSDYALLLGSVIEVPILFYGLHSRVAQRRDLSARASGLGSHDPLTGLDSNAAFLGKLGQSMATAERYRLPFAVLVINLANHSSLKHTHGRETADRAIVIAASRIRNAVQPSDALARVGETEFALLLEGPIDAAAATAVATRVVATGLRPSRRLPEAEALQFHIAVGHMEGQASIASSEAGACLARLQQSAQTMNDGSRKAIRLIKM